MKIQFQKRFGFCREFYIGLFGMGVGLFLLAARDRNTGMYLIYPRVIFISMILLGGIMTAAALFGKGKEDIAGVRISWFELAFLALLLAAKPLMDLLGIYSAVFLVGAVLSLLILRERTVRNIVKAIVFNGVMTAVLYLAFSVLLKVNTPKGLLF